MAQQIEALISSMHLQISSSSKAKPDLLLHMPYLNNGHYYTVFTKPMPVKVSTAYNLEQANLPNSTF